MFRSATRRPCEERALVLRAMQLEHFVTEQPDGCHLMVPRAERAAALEQLQLYATENPERRSEPWPDIPPRRGLVAAVAFVLALFVAYSIQSRFAYGIDWTATGQLIARRVVAGEWWRAVTALTLHADAAHVAGNILFGGFFGYLCGQYLGSGVALLAITWSAAAGNLVNAFLQPGWHRSIGASTAVFAALGLVAAFVWGISRRFALGWARRWAPVVGAVALLAYVGTGDERTDIVAHLTGFLAGAAGGLALFRLGSRVARPAWQVAAGVVAGLTLLAAWAAALVPSA
ncbi:MAG: rhomboid family intramembrane serine protease [Gammaproteobacteria bacterium]|nr:rhomboid family intramembrane serine protease [Gammaproteobacteria bacterium]